MDEKEYQEKIPPWCYYQTVEQHKECLMLCWGLVRWIKEGIGKPESSCRTCEFYVEKLGDTIVRDRYGKGD